MNTTTASDAMQRCIEQCLACYQSCQRMALNHCLERGGRHVEPQHFRLMIDCAEICRTRAAFMLSGSPRHRLTCGVCAELCRACADSCEQLGDMQECVDACRACARSCAEMAD